MQLFKRKEKDRRENSNGEINQIQEMLENLSWAAYHLFGEEFCDRYDKKQLTIQEWVNLVDAYITHTKNMQMGRKYYEWDLKKRDIRVLEGLTTLRNFLTK